MDYKNLVSLALEGITYKKSKIKSKSELGHLEFLKNVKILKNILPDLCESYVKSILKSS